MTAETDTAPRPALRATGVWHSYRASTRRRAPATPALANVSFTVTAGETLGLVGRSGSGKSTLLRILLALERPTDGEIHLDGERIRPGSVRSLRSFRRRVQYIPQDPAASLDPRMSVEQLVREPLARLDVAGQHQHLVRTALDGVGLPASLHRQRVRELSGGQAQRVAIARALATSPHFLLADEPVSGLDLPRRNRVLDLLAGLAQHRALGLIFVSHDLDAVSRLCSRSIVLHAGRVVEAGPTRDLLDHPCHPATQELVEAVPRLPAPRHPFTDPTPFTARPRTT
ncbi:ATP-binding cassette domain-containing protein [Cryobacterium sp. PH31-O1]|uniref:ABC transporter ATP-binding protein n=1 Tax=Cryobacterium sp. PH31-O1 TaxID=3046306 RepID=UPI0024BAD67B|nr:ATP-binding cassette domain-containing protein [Cryobacterium sp. PH31-O1]MDJ0337860.1 ATP-binding cassette domain-containing protein [Cryobacterium sp. PH31-O1]